MRRVAVVLMIVVVAAPLGAQRSFGRSCSYGSWDRDRVTGDSYWVPSGWNKNLPYDGQFQWARLVYAGNYACQQEGPGWAHDYPRSDNHFMKILQEVSGVNARPGGNIVRMDDPELMKYPITYLSEPGGWDPSPKETEGLRNYLKKGGFVIVDDFPNQAWWSFAAMMKRVLPEAEILPIEANHPIFHSFFNIDMEKVTADIVTQAGGYRGVPQFLAIFEDNDPKKRIMMMINFQADLGEFMEFADEGYYPVPISNEVWELGVNYVVYALTR
jgi:Domain of unknown function (DUF4159)